MTSTEVVTLPANGDSSRWTESEKALVEAAGLTSGNGPQKKFAPRPVVEAFLLHARRTGLDPIARQIYCIERSGRWGTQVSIDGARLVAERTGQYRGQTPTQWTADGREWVDVWLSKDNPAAARVGVYREGFVEPLFAVATWDAYNAGSPIWKKMPALMLGKCAEMLALRKAFPQDLSGLYSTEEMDQAGAPREVVRQVEQAPARPAATAEIEATQVPSRDWGTELEKVETLDAARALYQEAEAAGELGLTVGMTGDNDDGSAHTVMDLFWARRKELESQPTPLVEVEPEKPKRRQWVRDAKALESREEVRALYREAQAASVSADVLEQIAAFEESLPEVVEPVAAGGWPEPVADVPGEWVQGADGEWIEPPMALDDVAAEDES